MFSPSFIHLRIYLSSGSMIPSAGRLSASPCVLLPYTVAQQSVRQKIHPKHSSTKQSLLHYVEFTKVVVPKKTCLIGGHWLKVLPRFTSSLCYRCKQHACWHSNISDTLCTNPMVNFRPTAKMIKFDTNWSTWVGLVPLKCMCNTKHALTMFFILFRELITLELLQVRHYQGKNVKAVSR